MRETVVARENAINPRNAEGRRMTPREKFVREAIRRELDIVSSRFTDASKVAIEITPKGNYRIHYGDYDTGLTVGRIVGVTRADLRRYKLTI